MARRAASIWRLVSQQTSSAIRPKSPKLTVVPPFARPARRPRWTLRCLTRFGISIAQPSSDPGSGVSAFGFAAFLAGAFRVRVALGLLSELVDLLDARVRL